LVRVADWRQGGALFVEIFNELWGEIDGVAGIVHLFFLENSGGTLRVASLPGKNGPTFKRIHRFRLCWHRLHLFTIKFPNIFAKTGGSAGCVLT
jgi:hypothetical protein